MIHNMNYFLTDLKVFADGLIECWEMVDLPLFKGKLDSGWVVTSIPDDSPLDIHGLGAVELESPEWYHTPSSLTDFVQNTIEKLNPRMENLYDCHGRTTEEVDRVRYAAVSFGDARPWKNVGPASPSVRSASGKSLRHFRVIDGRLRLVTLAFFPDDSVVISGAPEEITVPFQSLREELGNPDVFRLPSPGDRVVIDPLVSFTVKGWQYLVDPKELAAEIDDARDQVLGSPGAVLVCVEAYQAYLAEPTADSLETLRKSYEAVPEHLRMYCGDMDTKDIPIRMVLYGKDQIERWSHYRAAKRYGMPLPSIKVPDPPENE